ncbi:hypothetical protein RM697_04945 [Ichthyenterobacterium sp. W332]|uniref:TonB-dependent receptor plug domain-containing protein n=1 Tax=Microcosmobacter mediterraneus TaxID=3075607 RepID=A0ABU2YL57_9FLAO|nr:hypothetical protein [Ichthyenterobacterium sp. W332]MDT0557980.1 hypothetical protein [Ichthyenterobacterium sp. W332]
MQAISIIRKEFLSKLTQVLFICAILSIANTNAQQIDIADSFEDYHSAPRELAYVHLNKSVYIEGEMLGFKAYVLDKNTKQLSPNTSNLYCTISDEEGNILKKKLVYVNNGVANNVFNVDDSLSTGIYTFKAYTNWMRNFKEANHFEQTFKVLDADNNAKIESVKSSNLSVDLQTLGEGGHILYDVSNNIGIVAKNELGYGVGNATGRIKDDNGNVVSEFTLNEVGIAKTLFTPSQGNQYTIELDLADEVVSEPISSIESIGLNLQLMRAKDRVLLEFKTNSASLSMIKEKVFKLALHNDSEIKISDFRFDEDQRLVMAYPMNELYSGINIFTVFDEDNKPVLERLFFNNQGIKRQKVSKTSLNVEVDSLVISLKLPDFKPEDYSSLSVSVLPSNTASYNHHNSILSQTYIQPYIKGAIENGHNYFKDSSRATMYNLDLLMLTQGWSSYNWDEIFNYNEVFAYPFERGIDVVANVNGKKGKGNYIVYPLENSKTKLFELSDTDKVFTAKSLIPTEDDLFRIGFLELQKDKFKNKPSLYLQFYPSEFADYSNTFSSIKEADVFRDNQIAIPNSLESWKNAEELDEVVITTDVSESRAEKLANKAVNSKVDIIEDYERRPGLRVDLYLQRLGWSTQYDYFSGTLSIINPRITWKDPVPLVYLDDALLTTSGSNSDFSLLTFITMDVVDYIEYELYGIGGGIRGGAGFIKIYTKQNNIPLNKAENVVTYDVPLRFSNAKRFYTPKYQYYNTKFFKEYGVIGWVPNLKPDDNGNLEFYIYDTKAENINLYIEGVVNGNSFVSETLIINTED